MSLLIDALHCQNQERPPVWLMRQAGRILPAYQALRKRYTLDELFQNSELAAQITALPIDILGVDAAILFTDIMVIAKALGLNVRFVEGKGPVVDPLLQCAEDVKKLKQIDVRDALATVQHTITLLKKELKVPLIGFCGGPFTVASYLILHQKWYATDPSIFHQLLTKITKVSIDYLKMQVEAGVDAIQIFDSWANALTLPEFSQFALPYLKQMLDALKATKIPVIVFCRDSSLRAEQLVSIEPRAISFDWHQEMHTLRKMVPASIAMQGNIDPEVLKAPFPVIKTATKKLLASMKNDPGFIVNLGHGVLPDTPLEHVQYFINLIKE